MVRHDELHAFGHRLVDDRRHRVDSEQNSSHRRIRVAARKPDSVPFGSEPRRVGVVEGLDEITDAKLSHGDEGTRGAQLASDSVAAARSASATPTSWMVLSRSLSSTQARMTVATG